MSGICITGLIQTDADFVGLVLQQSGMQLAIASQRDSSLSMARWHEQVLALPIERYVERARTSQSSSDLNIIQNVGRLWEQLASDIFIANMNNKVWGWVDARSTEVLPFWAQFDPQLKFVLVGCSFERYLTNVMQATEVVKASTSIDDLQQHWRAYHLALMHFHRMNADKSVLVGFDDVLLSPQGFVDLCAQRLGLTLSPVVLKRLSDYPVADLASLIAKKLATTIEIDESFWNDFQATLTPLPPMSLPALVHDPLSEIDEGGAERSNETSLPPADGKITVFDQYRKVLSAIQSQVTHRQSGNNNDFSDVNDVNDSMAEFAVTDLSFRDVASEQASTKVVEEPPINDFKEENDLLLAQLHQVQEELESYFLKHQTAVSELEALKKTAGEAANASVEAAASHTKEQQELKTLKERVTFKTKELNDLKASTDDKIKDIEEENDLLLAQLHQVKEELENYFLKYQDASRELEVVQARFQKLVARVPGYCELDGIEVLSHHKTQTKRTHWKVLGLESAGRAVPEVLFTTSIENGEGCLSFERDSQGQGGLLRWPAAADADMATVAAVGDETTGPERARVLRSLSTSDWHLVKTIGALVVKEITEPQLLSLPVGFDAKAVGQAMEKLNGHLNALPPIFHFDEVRLRSYQEEPEHEYLWFEFTNVLFGGKQAAKFEFRFSSVNVPASAFGSNPRLEFYESGSKPLFKAWFEECSDDHGSKLELRFAQPASMDMDVWAKISSADQLLISSLIAQLPLFIEQVKKEGRQRLMRPWDDWVTLAETVHGNLLLLTGGLEADGFDEPIEDDLEDSLADEAIEEDAVAKPKTLKRSARSSGVSVRSSRTSPTSTAPTRVSKRRVHT